MKKSYLILGVLFALLLAVTPALGQGGQDINVGDTVESTLDGGSIDYVLSLESGEAVTISLASDDFDTLIELSFEGQLVAEDDDSGEGTNSVLSFIAPSTGDYTVTVTSFGGDQSGAFTLSITRFAVQAIEVGSSIEGEITEPIAFTANLQEEQCITVQLAAPTQDFDPVLEVRDPEGNLLAEDDDGGEGRNSYLAFCAPISGTYAIIASSYFGASAAPYLLDVSEATPFAFTGPDNEEYEGVAEGTLTADDVRYTISLESGQTIVVDLQSDDFDTVVELVDANDGILESDDDTGFSSNSQFVYRSLITGTYTIVVRGFSSSATGAYTLRVAETTPVISSDGGTATTAVVERGNIGLGESITETATGPEESYTFSLVEETTIAVSLISEDFDAYLYLADTSGALLASDDDGGESVNSLIDITLPAGDYVIIVSRFGGSPTGAYTLTVE